MSDLVVRADGQCRLGEHTYRCALGSGGIVTDKHEGDGGTPVGTWPLRRLLYRPDRGETPACALPVEAISPDDGWCDDPSHADYNRPVTLPFSASHEVMWRDDHLYDFVVVVGHNDAPPVANAGSAIFLHLARQDWGPSAGCVTFAREDFLEILKTITPDSHLVVER